MHAQDSTLFKTFKSLPVFPFPQLVRPDLASVRQARDAFFSHKTTPTFTFSRAEKFDVKMYSEALSKVRGELDDTSAEEDLKNIYQEKIDELQLRCNLIQAIQEHDDEYVSAIADKLYGTPAQSAEALQQEFLSTQARAHELHVHKPMVNAELFSVMTQKVLEHYNMSNWTVRSTRRSNISLLHNSPSGINVVKIPAHLSLSRARAARVLTHEIETHALRTHNGSQSHLHILQRGLAHYLPTEEGLAIVLQQRLRQDDSPAPGFWDAWAAALSLSLGFHDVFDRLYRARLERNVALKILEPELRAQDTAWRLALRLYRGIHSPNNQGVGYRKDHIYRSGFLAVQAFLQKHGDEALPTLFAGNAGLQHVAFLQHNNITGRTPDFISQSVVREVMEKKG